MEREDGGCRELSWTTMKTTTKTRRKTRRMKMRRRRRRCMGK
jgi:hypothetical protein